MAQEMNPRASPGGRELRESLGPRDRRTARLCLGLMAVLGVGSVVGVGASLYLAVNAPLLLIALSPLLRHLVLVAPNADPVAFVLVGTARTMLFFLASFYLGRAFGPAGLTWLESRAPRTGGFVRWLERVFEKGSYAVVLLFAGPAVSMIAGISGMRVLVFASIATVAMVFRLLLILELGDWLREPLRDVLAVIDEYGLPGTIALLAAIAGYQWWKRRR